ncbi:hypothetical protein N330_09277, partial [Leptosomus discolor]
WGIRTGWQGSHESASHVLCAQKVLITTMCERVCFITNLAAVSCRAECGLNLYNQALLQNSLMKQSCWRVEIQRVNNNFSNLKQIISRGSISFVMKSALGF